MKDLSEGLESTLYTGIHTKECITFATVVVLNRLQVKNSNWRDSKSTSCASWCWFNVICVSLRKGNRGKTSGRAKKWSCLFIPRGRLVLVLILALLNLTGKYCTSFLPFPKAFTPRFFSLFIAFNLNVEIFFFRFAQAHLFVCLPACSLWAKGSPSSSSS